VEDRGEGRSEGGREGGREGWKEVGKLVGSIRAALVRTYEGGGQPCGHMIYGSSQQEWAAVWWGWGSTVPPTPARGDGGGHDPGTCRLGQQGFF